MSNVTFADLTPDEWALVRAITARAEAADLILHGDAADLTLDLLAVHYHTPLRLEGMATAREFDFAHDVIEIQRHLDRVTGRLRQCFLPRYYDPQATSQQALDAHTPEPAIH